jgi:hypothetical protein
MLKWPSIVAEQPIALEAPMSALGQKRTYAQQKGMSALPPKADIRRPTQISVKGYKRWLAALQVTALSAAHGASF